jgi:hypothetical protein
VLLETTTTNAVLLETANVVLLETTTAVLGGIWCKRWE